MTRTIETGQQVTDQHGSENTYGGESEHGPNWHSVKFSLLTGTSTVYCAATAVMPTAALPLVLNTKDPRMTATNDKANKPRSANGPWHIQTTNWSTWAKTKTAGLQEAARRLAIADWHEGA